MTINRYRFSRDEVDRWVEQLAVQLQRGNFAACRTVLDEAELELEKEPAVLIGTDKSCRLFELYEFAFWGRLGTGMPLRVANALDRIGVETIDDLLSMPKDKMEEARSFGGKMRDFVLYCCDQYVQHSGN